MDIFASIVFMLTKSKKYLFDIYAEPKKIIYIVSCYHVY
jgi:hypothetical protein